MKTILKSILSVTVVVVSRADDWAGKTLLPILVEQPHQLHSGPKGNLTQVMMLCAAL